MITNRFNVKDLSYSVTFNESIQEQQLYDAKMKAQPIFQIQDDNLVIKRENFPMLIQNIYDLDKGPRKLSLEPELDLADNFTDGIHLVVFVHGFQGNSFDMRLIKNYISFLYPESMFLCATANEDLTDSDIFEMGDRLALEIKTYISENFPNSTLGKISFIGHSLGGVKIRAALPKMLEYKNRFHAYISFSSPHLGYGGPGGSSVVEAGIWVLKKMKNS